MTNKYYKKSVHVVFDVIYIYDSTEIPSEDIEHFRGVSVNTKVEGDSIEFILSDDTESDRENTEQILKRLSELGFKEEP